MITHTSNFSNGVNCRQTAAFLLLCLLVSACSIKSDTVVDANKLHLRDALVYLSNSDTPFTGVSEMRDENNILSGRATWKNGKMNGPFETWHPNGAKLGVGSFKNGQLHGKQTVWYPSGALQAEQEYIDGMAIGKRIEWYESGQKKSEHNYQAGKTYGPFVEWNEDGGKLVGEFRNDLKHGKWQYFHPDGYIIMEEEYADGVTQSVTAYPNGKKAMTSTYSNGIQQGLIVYDDNGQWFLKSILKNGEVVQSFKNVDGVAVECDASSLTN